MTANYVLLERIELAASAASVSFTNIPQTGYTDLKVVISARTNRANAVDSLGFYFNGDSTVARYSGRVLYGTGSTAASNAPNPVNDETMFVAGDNATANTFGNSELYIPNYTGSTQKSASVDSVGENNATTARSNISAILYNQTTAISSITFTPITGTTILANSTFSLYGLAAVGTTPAIAPKASGGNITTDGTYWYHTFLASGNFVPQVGLTCDVLTIAGGASGGTGRGDTTRAGGGGGAGGLLYSSSNSVSATSYTVTVGAGGASQTATNDFGFAGSNSQFGSLTAAVGGGASSPTYPGTGSPQITGGSGGGGAPSGGVLFYQGLGTSGQGNDGGTGTSSLAAGGGGGGAGSAGSNSSSGAGGAGGAGLNTYSSWATTTGTGASGYYAGGGGGGGSNSGGSGGSGGGGAGTSGGTGTAGTINTGSGGGGTGNSGTVVSGSGGSGVVIIRYLAA